jgi:hypothetical protein
VGELTPPKHQLIESLDFMSAARRNTKPLLKPGKLLRLYRQRHQFKPTGQELKHILDSMGYHWDRQLFGRYRELGWFWVRSCSRARLEKMLAIKQKQRRNVSWENGPRRRLAESLKDRAKLLQKLKGKFASLDDRLDTIRSLAACKNKADLPLFRQLAAERSFPVGLALHPALELFRKPNDVELLFQLGRINVTYALDALAKCPGQAAVAAIHKLARQGNDYVRANLAGRLYLCRNPIAPRLLRRLARDRHYWVRRSVAQSLGALCRPEDLPLLRRLCQDSNADVRLEAVWAVGLYRRKEDIPLLMRMATDQCDMMRTVAAMALTRVMRRTELERWLEQEDRRLSLEVLREVDFALYAPKWSRKSHSRLDDQDIRYELGVAWFGKE